MQTIFFQRLLLSCTLSSSFGRFWQNEEPFGAKMSVTATYGPTSACHNFFVLRSAAPSASQTLYFTPEHAKDKIKSVRKGVCRAKT